MELTKLGLGDDIIEAKIKSSSCRFSLSNTDLADLKKAGVSEKVIVAMLEAGEPTIARVTVGSSPLELHTFGRAKLENPFIPRGMGGVQPAQEKAYMEGRHSPVVVPGNSPILIELFRHDTIDNYLLARMGRKGDRRELELAAASEALGAKIGVSDRARVTNTWAQAGGNRYTLTPNMSTTGKPLPRGEYIIFVVGSMDTSHGVYGKGYDFTVE
jgi:hypothetical protein